MRLLIDRNKPVEDLYVPHKEYSPDDEFHGSGVIKYAGGKKEFMKKYNHEKYEKRKAGRPRKVTGEVEW